MDDKDGKLQVGSAIDKMSFWQKRRLQKVAECLDSLLGGDVTAEKIVESVASGVTLQDVRDKEAELSRREAEAKKLIESARSKAETIISSANEEVSRLQDQAKKLEGRVGELRGEAKELEGTIEKAKSIEYRESSEGDGSPTYRALVEEDKKISLKKAEREGRSLKYADDVIPHIRRTASDVEALVQRERTEKGLPTKVDMTKEARLRMMRLLGIAKAYYDSHITESRVEIMMPNGVSLSDFIRNRLSEVGPAEDYTYLTAETTKAALEEFVKGYISTLPESEQKEVDFRGTIRKIYMEQSKISSFHELLATPSKVNPIETYSGKRLEIPEGLDASDAVLQAILDSDDEIFRLYNPERITRHEAIKKREETEREENEQ